MELSPDTIEDVMRVALKKRASVVIDLFDKDILEYWDEIVSKVVKLLLYENEEHGLRHIIFEEASEFIHQYGKKTESSTWIERLVRLSGNVKVGASFINQNAESISKNVLKLCDGRIVGRQTEKNSIDMARKWLSGAGVDNATEISETLPNLKSGQFWIWSTSDNHPVLANIPDIKSLHPSRNDISSSDVKKSDDLQSVMLEMINISQSRLSIIEQTPDIDISFDTSKLNFFERYIVRSAESTRLENGTVRSAIDSLIRSGYTEYNSIFGSLRGGDRVFFLHSDIEKQYASLILSKIGY